jgi:hypothetical protein
MENKSKFHLVKENSFLILCVCFFALFVILAAVSGAWPGKDISAQFFSAMAGALIAAIITLFLLKGQTAVEADRQRDSKVFEEKLRIYQDFLHKLCDVVKDQKITPEEEIELQFQVSCIAMHTSSESIKNISVQVKDIIERIKNNDTNKKLMLEELFKISDSFNKELYGDKIIKDKDADNEEDSRRDTIANFEILVYSDMNKYEKMRELKDRFKELKNKIDKSGSNSCSLLYNSTLINYEYYTATNAKGEYIKTPDRIAVDLLLDGDEFVIRVGTRKNDPEKTKRITNAVDDRFTPGNTELTGAHWHVHAKFAQETPDDKIIEDMNDLLMRIYYYRNGKLSSK